MLPVQAASRGGSGLGVQILGTALDQVVSTDILVASTG